MTGYGSREELMGEIRETGEVPDVFLTDQRDLAWLQESAEPAAGRLAADRARGRLRRPLLPRRGARLQRRLPAAVHAGRDLADGDLLQHRARRLRDDGRAGPARARPRGSTGTSSSSSPRRSSPAARNALDAGHPRRPDAARASRPSSTPPAARSSTTRRRRRRSRSPTTRTQSALGTVLPGAARPAADAEREAARRATGDGVVQARQARHDPRLPRPGADAAAGARA